MKNKKQFAFNAENEMQKIWIAYIIVVVLVGLLAVSMVANHILIQPQTPLIAPVSDETVKDIDLCTLDYIECDTDEKKNFKILTNQIVYGYTSLEALTDSSPFITASGLDLHLVPNFNHGIIANNCRPFGSRVWIDGRIFVVEDRMNSRYDCNTWDIWFPTYEEAVQHGRQLLEVKVYN